MLRKPSACGGASFSKYEEAGPARLADAADLSGNLLICFALRAYGEFTGDWQHVIGTALEVLLETVRVWMPLSTTS